MISSEAYRDWKGWDSDSFGSHARQRSFYAAETQRAGVKVGPGVRVLEVGFGNGDGAAWVRSIGADYVGTELDPELVARARRAGMNAIQAGDSAELERLGPFGVVLAWDVIEHIPRDGLVPFLADLRKAMLPSGTLIARLPSGDSPFSGAIQYGDLTHSAPLGSAAIRLIVRQAGFSAVEVYPTAFPVFGDGARSAIRRLIVRTCDALMHPLVRLLMRNPVAILTPNMTVVMRA